MCVMCEIITRKNSYLIVCYLLFNVSNNNNCDNVYDNGQRARTKEVGRNCV